MQQMLCLVIEILFELHSGQSDALVGAGGFGGAQFADLDAAVEVAAARQTLQQNPRMLLNCVFVTRSNRAARLTVGSVGRALVW